MGIAIGALTRTVQHMEINRNLTSNQIVIGFDLETTGVDVTTSRIVTAAFIVDYPDGTSKAFEWLVNPGVEIPEEATSVHGVTNDHARENGMDPVQFLRELTSHMRKATRNGLIVVGHNVSYDLTLLTAELRRHGMPDLPWFPVADTIVLDKALDPYRRGGRTLTAVSDHYGVVLENAHTADADAIAAVKIFRALAQKYPDKIEIPVVDLYRNQITWRHEQQNSLEAYLRKVKKDDSITLEKTWPMYLDDINSAA